MPIDKVLVAGNRSSAINFCVKMEPILPKLDSGVVANSLFGAGFEPLKKKTTFILSHLYE